MPLFTTIWIDLAQNLIQLWVNVINFLPPL